MDVARTEREIQAAERKAEADARAAEIAAESALIDRDQKQAEFGEWQTRGQLRDSEARANARALELKNEEAERASMQALVPDLSKVERGSTTMPESSTVFEGLLAGRALQDAARQLIPVVKGDAGLGDDFKLLITTDLDLAAADASYVSVIGQLEQLRGLIEQYLRPIREALAPLTSVAVAAAQLVPGLLSLISAKRTISASNTQIDDEVAMMAAAGALAGADAEATVVVDKVRILDLDGPAHKAWASLQSACNELSAYLDVERAGEAPDPNRIAEGSSLLKTCQGVLLAMTSVPEGASMTPLAQATLQEALHSDEFQGVLVVKGGASSSTQLVDDRPLRFGDPLSVVCTATIAYLLIDHHNGSRVLRGGLATGSAQTWGKIGSRLDLPE